MGTKYTPNSIFVCVFVGLNGYHGYHVSFSVPLQSLCVCLALNGYHGYQAYFSVPLLSLCVCVCV